MHDTLALMGVSYHRSEALSIVLIVFPLYSLFAFLYMSLTSFFRNVTIPPNKARASCKGCPCLILSIRYFITHFMMNYEL